MSEKDKTSFENQEQNAEILEQAGLEKRAELEKKLENNAEKSGEQNPDDARHEIEKIVAERNAKEEQEKRETDSAE